MHSLIALLIIAGYRLRGTEGLHLIGKSICVLNMVLVTWPISFYHATALAAASWAGLVVGHGAYYRLGYEPAREGDNWAAALPRWLGLKREAWLFNAVALSITGLAFTAPASLCLAYNGRYGGAVLLAAAGLAKPLTYDLGWRLWTGLYWRQCLYGLGVRHGTEPGEYLTGFILAIALIFA